jgi:hypothetical protein
MTPPECLLLGYTSWMLHDWRCWKTGSSFFFSLFLNEGIMVFQGLFGASVHYIAYNACIFWQDFVFHPLFTPWFFTSAFLVCSTVLVYSGGPPAYPSLPPPPAVIRSAVDGFVVG